jgi:hypothetical protein
LGAVNKWLSKTTRLFQREIGRKMSNRSRSIKLMTRGKTGTVNGDPVINYQDKGVKGHGRGKSPAKAKFIPKNTPYSFKSKNPPAKAFERYTGGDKGSSFAIAASVGKNGVPATLVVTKAISKTFDSKIERKKLASNVATSISERLQITIKNQTWQ